MSPAPRGRLIWNADDFGFSGAVNEGIALAHRTGLVRGASLLAGGEAFDGAVALAKMLPELDVGVHLAAVAERPILAPEMLPHLAGRGGRLPESHVAFLWRYLAGPLRAATVEAEWEAQIARVRDAGLTPVYLDSHQHLHVLPGLMEATLRLAKRFGIRAVRTPGDFVPGRPGPVRGALLGALFALGRRARAMARREGLFTADGTLGILDAGRLDAARIRSWLPLLALRPWATLELVSHPGMGEPPGSAASLWGYHWADEMEAARNESLAEALRDCRIDVVGYRDCLGRR